MASSIGRKYGWLPSRPNKLPKLKLEHLKAEADLPQKVDLRDEFPPCYDQGQLGSCVGNGVAGVIHHQIIKTNYKWQFTPSRLFVYYNARAIEGTTSSDSGAQIVDGVNGVNALGVCPEAEADGSTPNWLWTYSDQTNDPIPFVKLAKFKQKPSPICYQSAKLHKALQTSQVNLDRLSVLNTLAAGKPIVFGMSVYDSFEAQDTMNTGIVPVPADSENLLGGHCIVAVGYLLNTPMGTQGVKDWAIVRNSWGTDLYTQNSALGNMQGNFVLPLNEVMCSANFSSDAHVVDLVGA